MRKRMTVALAVTGLLGGLLVGAITASAAPAGPTLGLSRTTVAQGQQILVTPNGCLANFDGTPGQPEVYQNARVILITGSGADERLAAFGEQIDETRVSLTVPAWVDPAEPAVVAGWCQELRFTDSGVTTSRAFTYPDAPIDITPGAAAPAPSFTLDRTTAAGGQVLRATTSGCAGDGYAAIAAYAGADLSGRTFDEFDAVSDGEGSQSGNVLELALNHYRYRFDDFGGNAGPLPEGPYTVLAGCSGPEGGTVFSEPMAISVVGSFPSGDISLAQDSGVARLSGGGCTGGQTVAVTFKGYAQDGEEFRGALERATQAFPEPSAERSANIAPDTRGQFTETVTTVAGADGTWTLDWTAPDALDAYAQVTADCGDPFADGFRYVEQNASFSNAADLFVGRTSPTSSPTGGPVTVHVNGSCDGQVRVSFQADDGSVLSESAPTTIPNNGGDFSYGDVAVMLTAPAEPGQYRLGATCDDAPGYPDRYEVFAPTTLADPAPLPAEPTTGWPSSGERETFAGRIGPIELRPDMDMGELDALVQEQVGHTGDGSGVTATTVASPAPPPPGGSGGLPSSQIGIEVPRPSGDFAITKATFDLVDTDGMPVSQSEAHLHHFVVSNVASKNPACPSSTFGLPGEIVAASGAERTALSVDDPYGIVVKDTDEWFGVYDVMNKTDESKTVYLTYDLTIRRDVENVRPLRTYFGSATGCGSFTWNIDGSGTPDTQSTYVSVAKDGVMVGTGAHIHNGGSHADMTDDRGRRLCRSELKLGESGGGHGGHGGMGMGDEPGYAPEFYPDDPMIEGITNCRVREQLRKGERLRFDAVYTNERARSSVMGIYTFYVWEGGGPATPEQVAKPDTESKRDRPGPAPGARPITGRPNYTG